MPFHPTACSAAPHECRVAFSSLTRPEQNAYFTAYITPLQTVTPSFRPLSSSLSYLIPNPSTDLLSSNFRVKPESGSLATPLICSTSLLNQITTTASYLISCLPALDSPQSILNTGTRMILWKHDSDLSLPFPYLPLPLSFLSPSLSVITRVVATSLREKDNILFLREKKWFLLKLNLRLLEHTAKRWKGMSQTRRQYEKPTSLQ